MGVVYEPWGMIWIDPSLVADLCKSAHTGDDVAIALVDKSLSIPIVRFFDPHVAKVHRADAISPAKVADRLCRIFTVFGRNARVKEYAIGPTVYYICLLYTSPSPRDRTRSRMPSSA